MMRGLLEGESGMKKLLVVVFTLLAVGVGVLLFSGGATGVVEMQASTTINARPSEVYRWISSPDKLTLWVDGLEFSQEVSLQRFGVGSKLRTSVNVRGRSFPMDVEITAHQPPTTFAIHQENDYYAGDVRYDLLERNGVTLVTSTAIGRYKGPLRILAPIEQPAAQRSAEESLERLKYAIETKNLR